MDDGRKGHGGDSEWRDQCRRWTGNRNGSVVDRECHWKGSEGPGRDEGGEGGGGSRGHRVVGGRDDGLEPKGGGGGGRAWGRSIATGLGRKPVGGCYSAEMRRPAIRSTAHDPILGLPWGHTTLAGSGWLDWFMGVCRGACWIGAMGLIHGGVSNDKVTYGCWI